MGFSKKKKNLIFWEDSALPVAETLKIGSISQEFWNFQVKKGKNYTLWKNCEIFVIILVRAFSLDLV